MKYKQSQHIQCIIFSILITVYINTSNLLESQKLQCSGRTNGYVREPHYHTGKPTLVFYADLYCVS